MSPTNLVAVTTPVALICFVNKVSEVTVEIPAKVAIPVTFKLSNSVSPSTSRLPFASIVPVNVDVVLTVSAVSYTHLRAHET